MATLLHGVDSWHGNWFANPEAAFSGVDKPGTLADGGNQLGQWSRIFAIIVFVAERAVPLAHEEATLHAVGIPCPAWVQGVCRRGYFRFVAAPGNDRDAGSCIGAAP